MFLEHLLKFGLVKDTGTANLRFYLSHQILHKESNVLNPYPLESRKIFAQQTVQLLIEQTVQWGEISSARCLVCDMIRLTIRSHLKFTLECIGQSFNLPVSSETMPIISGATDLYSKWLFNADGKRPKPIELDEQQFYRVQSAHCSSF